MKMDMPHAVVISAAIAAGTFLLSNHARTQPAEPPPAAGVRYQIAATPGQTVANAWRLDLRTGEVFRCFATGGVFGALCRRARFVELANPRPDGPEAPDPDSAGRLAALR